MRQNEDANKHKSTIMLTPYTEANEWCGEMELMLSINAICFKYKNVIIKKCKQPKK